MSSAAAQSVVSFPRLYESSRTTSREAYEAMREFNGTKPLALMTYTPRILSRTDLATCRALMAEGGNFAENDDALCNGIEAMFDSYPSLDAYFTSDAARKLAADPAGFSVARAIAFAFVARKYQAV